MAYLVDSWAWVQYFRGGEPRERLRALIDAGGHATSVLTLAELADRASRDGIPDPSPGVEFIRSKTRLLGVEPAVAVAAGRRKWAQRRKGRDMGLLDAIIYETARHEGLVVLTGDEGFRGLEGVEFLA